MLTARNPMSDRLRFRYVSVIKIILVQNTRRWNNRFTVITFNISSASLSTVCFNAKKIRQSTGKEDIRNIHFTLRKIPDFVKISAGDITSRHIQRKFVCSVRSDNCICPKFPTKIFQNKRDKTCPIALKRPCKCQFDFKKRN